MHTVADVDGTTREGDAWAPATTVRATRQQLREAVKPAKAAGRPKHYIFAYRPPTKAFNLKLSFAKSRVNRDEIISALEAILQELRADT